MRAYTTAGTDFSHFTRRATRFELQQYRPQRSPCPGRGFEHSPPSVLALSRLQFGPGPVPLLEILRDARVQQTIGVGHVLVTTGATR